LKKIAICGTHGCGKTTLSFRLATQAKSLGISAKVVQEVARESPFELNEGFTKDCAEWIFHRHCLYELNAKSEKVELLITDRSALDSLVYLRQKENNYDPDTLMRYAMEYMQTYDKVILVKPDVPLESDGVRSIDEEFQKDIDRRFSMYINNAKIDALVVKSSSIFAGGVFINDEFDVWVQDV